MCLSDFSVSNSLSIAHLATPSLSPSSPSSLPPILQFRFFLGAGQLPVHLFRLYPGRVNTTVADTGKVPTGIRPKLFYKAIDVCNVCIALVLIGSAFQIRRLLDLENLDVRFSTVYAL